MQNGHDGLMERQQPTAGRGRQGFDNDTFYEYVVPK